MALTATDLFNDATTREIGGIGPDQVNLIVSDLIGVQQMLQAAVPQINNLSDLHTQVIINQLNEEIASIENANSPTGTLTLGTDLGQFVGRAINYRPSTIIRTPSTCRKAACSRRVSGTNSGQTARRALRRPR